MARLAAENGVFAHAADFLAVVWNSGITRWTRTLLTFLHSLCSKLTALTTSNADAVFLANVKKQAKLTDFPGTILAHINQPGFSCVAGCFARLARTLKVLAEFGCFSGPNVVQACTFAVATALRYSDSIIVDRYYRRVSPLSRHLAL
jgi:hypothetical protein